jgi:hypothetical protein
MTNEQSSELAEPSVGSFDDPAAFVAAQLSAIFIAPVPAVASVRHDQLDASFLQPLAQWVRVVGAVSDHPFRLLPGPAFGPGDADLCERGFRKRSFTRRGTFQPNSQWKTLAVDQYHPLRSLAALGFTDRSAPFFAGAKLPSRKLSSHFSRPSPSRAPSNARHASSQTSFASHCFRRRQQVAGDGYLSGRNRHAAPVCSTQRIPSRHARFEAQGRPRLSFRLFGSGNSGSINSHCASVNRMNRFLLTSQAHQTILFKQQYPA